MPDFEGSYILIAFIRVDHLEECFSNFLFVRPFGFEKKARIPTSLITSIWSVQMIALQN
jgi:hypothetical protein